MNSIFISIFLINFEITIVSTTVVPIANYLHDFAQSSWVITAYLCTYLGTILRAHLWSADLWLIRTMISWAGFMGEIERHLWAEKNTASSHVDLHGLFRRLWSSADNGAIVSLFLLVRVGGSFVRRRLSNDALRIICRAFQGIGGGGIYSISLIMTYELVPEHKYPLYTGLATIAVALGLALGPLLGGLIANAADSSVWRWTFLVK